MQVWVEDDGDDDGCCYYAGINWTPPKLTSDKPDNCSSCDHIAKTACFTWCQIVDKDLDRNVIKHSTPKWCPYNEQDKEE